MTFISTSTHRARLLVSLGVVAFAALLASAILLATGCAPQVAANDRTQAEEDPLMAQPVDWSIDDDCETCHAAEEATMVDDNCPQASLHGDMECLECHTAEDAMTEAHANLTLGDAISEDEIKPKANTVDAESCQNPECHGTMEEMAKLTEGNTEFKDEKGKVQNPHVRPSNEQHDAYPPTCTDCHKIHSENIQEDAMDWCAQCHHKGVFQCGTCHELRQRADIG